MKQSLKYFLFYIVPIILISAYIFLFKPNEDESLENIIKHLIKIENDIKLPFKRPKVAVGFISCIDILSHYRDFLNNLQIKPHLSNVLLNTNYFNNKEELVDTFLYYFRHGASAARITFNDELFSEIENAIQSSASKRIRLGGNAHVMSRRFDIEGADVFLMASVSLPYINFVTENVYVGGNSTEEEELHLILEYERDDEWDNYIATRANRFMIYKANDITRLPFTEQFLNNFLKFEPQILVIAGFRLINNSKYTNDQSGMQNVINFLNVIPQSICLHIEMSSFGEMVQIGEIVDIVVNHADSVGMNEQELPKMIAYLNGHLEYSGVHDSQPSIETTLDKMRLLMSLMKTRNRNNKAPSRIHLHTLTFQAIMLRDTRRWNNTREAAAKSVLTAYRHTCGTHDINLNNVRLLFNSSFLTGTHKGAKTFYLDILYPVVCWSENEVPSDDGFYSEELYDQSSFSDTVNNEGLIKFCVVPGIICKNVTQTVGGGDNVSSATLLVQIFNSVS